MGKLIDLEQVSPREADAILDRVVDVDARIFNYRSVEDQQRYAEGIRDRSRGKKLVVLYEEGSELIGFNLITIHPVDAGGRRVWAVSSNAGFLPGHTGKNRTFPDAIRAMIREKLRHPERSYHFVCTLASPSGYELFADACPGMYPSPKKPVATAFERALLADLVRHDGAEIVADEPERLVVTVGCAADDGTKPRRPSELTRFYERLNPRYAQGDLLGVCVPLGFGNLLAGAYRTIRRTVRKQLAATRPAPSLPARPAATA